MLKRIGNKYQKPIIVLNSIWIHRSKSNKRLYYRNHNLQIMNTNSYIHSHTHTQKRGENVAHF